MSEAKYIVVEEWADGLTGAWGPFSDHRAAMAAEALIEAQGGVLTVHIVQLHSSGELDRELPDWKRSARV